MQRNIRTDEVKVSIGVFGKSVFYDGASAIGLSFVEHSSDLGACGHRHICDEDHHQSEKRDAFLVSCSRSRGGRAKRME